MMSDAISVRGNLSQARVLALQALQQAGCDSKSLAELYQRRADDILFHNESFVLEQVAAAAVQMPSTTSRVQLPPLDEQNCWNWDTEQSSDPLELWDQCCSQVTGVVEKESPPPPMGVLAFGGSSGASHQQLSVAECYLETGARLCCELHPGSSSYLRLPALRELGLRMRVQTDDDDDDEEQQQQQQQVDTTYETYELEQDGLLRPFDPAGVLWPTGYLLGLCVAAPRRCGVPEVYEAAAVGDAGPPQVALELGAGIGVPSIALTRALTLERSRSRSSSSRPARKPLIVAADRAPQARTLTASNSHAARASVSTVHLDHSNITAISEFRSQQYPMGFSIILGSALPNMFDESTKDPSHHLWKTLDILLTNSSDLSIALLAHTVHSLEVPGDGKFERIRTISGDKFGMKTRWGESSDFHISVMRRVVKSQILNDQEGNAKEL